MSRAHRHLDGPARGYFLRAHNVEGLYPEIQVALLEVLGRRRAFRSDPDPPPPFVAPPLELAHHQPGDHLELAPRDHASHDRLIALPQPGLGEPAPPARPLDPSGPEGAP